LGQGYTLGGEEEGGITRQQGDAMSTVPAEELAERQAGARYHAQRRINEIDGLIRGYRAAVNLIIKEEKVLLKEKESLQEVEGLGK